MKKSLAAIALAGSVALAGAVPAMADGGAKTADASGNYAFSVSISEAGTQNVTATGVNYSLILWSLVGTGALASGATSVVVVRRRAKAEAAA
jgi:hypothetical protein